MSIPRGDRTRGANDENATDRINYALSVARRLIRFGVPVFAARVDENGDPDTETDRRWNRWHKYPADLDILGSFKPGDALAAVCGITFDVIDIDPRHGGVFSAKRMAEDLGDFGPVLYGKVRTPSGGQHWYIASLGIGSHNGVMPGIDLKGGYPDGTGRGFVFIPPTIRPVKGLDGEGGVISGADAVDRIRMGTYRWTEPVQRPIGDPSSEEVTGYLAAAIESNRSKGTPERGGRESPEALRQACITAESGFQRTALLRYVHELERRGYAKGDILIILQATCREMPAFDKRRPWYPSRGSNPNRELLTLFHRSGKVIPDAVPGELDGISGPSVARVLPQGLTSFADIDRGLVEWLWRRYLAIGDIAILDGDPGHGKSLVTLDVGARITNGEDMPDGTAVGGGAGAVLLLAPEDSDKVTAARLEAAGANISLVYRPTLVLRKKKGEKNAKAYSGGDMLSFPNSTEKVRRWLVAYNIRLLIVDPITAFLDESVNSSVDASVRRALAPLSGMLSQIGCSALFIRHYNKNTQLQAQHRGGGSVAFGAVSRMQMVSGIVPEEARSGLPNVPGQVFGITQVKNNHLEKRLDQTLAYTIEDSDVVADTDGNMAPRVRWLGEVTVSAEELASGPQRRRGPAPMVQEEIISVLSEMFKTSAVLDARDATKELRSAGITANPETIAKARNRMGVTAKARHEKGRPGISGWDWSMPAKEKVDPDFEEE